MHRRLFYIYLLNVPSFSSRYFNKIKLTSRLGRLLALSLEILCHCAELNKIVEATMPVNPYDDRKVSLRRPHGNGDLDIVGASSTRRKANVTEA